MAARETGRAHPRPPLSTGHAEDRWNERSQHDRDTGIELWTAWVDALQMELPEPWALEGDEARYHIDSKVILCRRDTSITTVYDVTGEDAHPVVQESVENQFGISLDGL